MQQQSVYVPKPSAEYLEQPEMYKLVRSKENALDAYLETKERLGEGHSRTRIKFAQYILKAQLIQIKETISDVREIIGDFAAIAQELESLFEIDFGEAARRITRGVEKYPKFMQKFIVRRRAKKYYGQKMTKLRNMMIGVQIGVETMTGFTGIIMDSMLNISASFNNLFAPNKKGKKGGDGLTPEIAAEIERAEKARSAGSGQAQMSSSTVSGEGTAPSASATGNAVLEDFD